MAKTSGLFITVEGVEGAGKSTIMRVIEGFLKQHILYKNKEIDFVITREPGGTEIAEAIRRVLLNCYEDTMSEDTELLLYFAARAEHLAQLILPALQSGKIVVCDRFTDASYAYQGGGRGIPEQRLAALENWVQGDLRPDVTILLDVSAEIGLKRASGRGALDRIEKEQIEFFERVRTSYLKRAKRFKNQYVVINANNSKNIVKKAVEKVLDNVLQTWR